MNWELLSEVNLMDLDTRLTKTKIFWWSNHRMFLNETKNRISKIFERIGIYYNRLSGRLNVWNAIDIHRNKSQFNLIFYFFKLFFFFIIINLRNRNQFRFLVQHIFISWNTNRIVVWMVSLPLFWRRKKTILDCRQFTCKNFLSDSQLCVHAFTQTRRSKRRRRKKKWKHSSR